MVGVKKLRVLGDSQLIVRQVETLLPLLAICEGCLQSLLHLASDPSMIGQQGNIFSVQVMGRYKVSNEGLRRLYTRVKKVQKSFESFQIEHVFRWAGELQEFRCVMLLHQKHQTQGHIDCAVLQR